MDRNVAANFVGKGWTAIVQILFIPVYLHYLGPAAYGLIGFHVLLLGLLMVIDAGAALTITREIACRTAGGVSTLPYIRTLLKTAEVWYLTIGVTLLLVLVIAAPQIGQHWLRNQSLPPHSVVISIQLMGAQVALVWLSSLYQATLAGLQRMVWINLVGAAFATIRAGGVIAVLVWLSASIEAFFLFQLAVTLVEVLLLRARSWGHLKPRSPTWVDHGMLWTLRRYSGALAATFVISVLIVYADKTFLSRAATLEVFGHYMLASAVAGSLALFSQPIVSAAYPRFAQLCAQHSAVELAEAYLRYARLIGTLVPAGAAILYFFAPHILLLWTRDKQLSEAVAPLVAPLALGAAFSGLLALPNQLLAAAGNVRPMVSAYGGVLLLYLPILHIAIGELGALGASYAWLTLTVVCLLVLAPSLLRAVLSATAIRNWLLGSIFVPFAVSLPTAYLAFLVMPDHRTSTLYELCLSIALGSVCTLVAVMLGLRGVFPVRIVK